VKQLRQLDSFPVKFEFFKSHEVRFVVVCTCVLYTSVLVSSARVFWCPLHVCFGILYTCVLVSSTRVFWYPLHACFGVLCTCILVSSARVVWYPLHVSFGILCTCVLSKEAAPSFLFERGRLLGEDGRCAPTSLG
jgi:hypothetical protein